MTEELAAAVKESAALRAQAAALDDEAEVFLSVPGDCTLGDVKRSLAQALGRPDVAQVGRFVGEDRRTALPDTEKLGQMPSHIPAFSTRLLFRQNRWTSRRSEKP